MYHTHIQDLLEILKHLFENTGTRNFEKKIIYILIQQKNHMSTIDKVIIYFKLSAYIPAPIMFGNTIDSTCLLWKETCGSRGDCLMYDIEMFRFKYIGKTEYPPSIVQLKI